MSKVKLTINLKLRSILDMVFGFANTIIASLINLLLWDQFRSISTILNYNLYVSIGYFIAIIVVTYFSTRLSVKLLYFFARLFPMIPLIFFVFFQENISPYIFIIGLIVGFGQINLNVSRMTFYQSLVEKDNNMLNSMFSYQYLIWGGLSLVVPFAVVTIVESRFQILSLILIILIHIILGIIHLFWNVKKFKQEQYLITLLRDVFNDKRILKIGLAYLLIGISGGFSLGILDAISLEQLGGFDSWLYLSIIVAVLSLVVSQLFSRLRIGNNSLTKSLIMIIAMVYGLSPIALVFTFNSTMYVVFIIIKVFFDLMIQTLFNTFINILEEDENLHDKHILAYQIFNEVTRALGIFIVLFGLRLLPDSYLNPQLLTIILSLISIVPFLFLRSVLGKSNPSHRFYFKSMF